MKCEYITIHPSPLYAHVLRTYVLKNGSISHGIQSTDKERPGWTGVKAYITGDLWHLSGDLYYTPYNLIK